MHIQLMELENKVIKMVLGSLESKEDKQVSGEIELDIGTHKEFTQNIMGAMRLYPGQSIIVDLKNVNYMDSYGIWTLLEMHKKAFQAKCHVCFINITSDAKRVLDITKISSRLLIYTNEKTALEELQKI